MMGAQSLEQQFEVANQAQHHATRLWVVDAQWKPKCGTVQSLMAREQFTLSPETTARKAAITMNQLDLDHVPVVNADGRMVGLLTYTCLVRLIRFGLTDPGPDSLVNDVMVHQPITVKPSTTLSDALNILRQHNFHYLPVVDESGALLGSVCSRDLLRVVSHRLETSLESKSAK